MKKKHSTLRLVRNGVLDDPRTEIIQRLGYEGFTHHTIYKALKQANLLSTNSMQRRLTLGSISYRLKRLGLSTSSVRRAETQESQERLNTALKQSLTPRLRKRA